VYREPPTKEWLARKDECDVLFKYDELFMIKQKTLKHLRKYLTSLMASEKVKRHRVDK